MRIMFRHSHFDLFDILDSFSLSSISSFFKKFYLIGPAVSLVIGVVLLVYGITSDKGSKSSKGFMIAGGILTAISLIAIIVTVA